MDSVSTKDVSHRLVIGFDDENMIYESHFIGMHLLRAKLSVIASISKAMNQGLSSDANDSVRSLFIDLIRLHVSENELTPYPDVCTEFGIDKESIYHPKIERVKITIKRQKISRKKETSS